MSLTLHPSHVGVIMRALVVAEKALEEQYLPQVKTGQMQIAEMIAELTDIRLVFAELRDHAYKAVQANPRWARMLPLAVGTQVDDTEQR